MVPEIKAQPRIEMARTPTPLEFCPNLTKAVGGADIWVKRDDETGLAMGGNKVRQLEYYFGAAKAEDADTVLITGAVQSNFVRCTAAFAAKLGMDCHIQLEERVSKDSEAYRTSGNVLLDQLLGATLYSYPEGEDEVGADAELHKIADRLRGEGRRPYIIPLAPGHPPHGALGYFHCAEEIITSIDNGDAPSFDEIVVGSGSGATHGGLLFGMRALGNATPIRGACVRRSVDQQQPRIMKRCVEIAELLGRDNPVTEADVIVDDTHLAPGYGQISEATRNAIHLAARTEALITDPVYTGKTMATTISQAKALGPGKSVLMIHTGGTPAVFAYGQDL